MVEDIAKLQEQIDRCRRLAASMTDDDMRQSLEELASEYEARVRRRKDSGFMLRGGPSRH